MGIIYNNMTKGLFFILFAVFLSVSFISFASAEIKIENLKDSYSLGDELNVKLSALENNAAEGTMNLILSCDSYQLPFFVTYVSLKAGETKVFTVEPLKVSQSGTCTLKAELKNVNETLESAETSQFPISDSINITLQTSKTYYNPGETVEIIGTVQKANGMQFNGPGTISFDKDYSMTVKGNFIFELKLDPGIKSGRHTFAVTVEDENGNKGKIEQEIFINAIPTKIIISPNKNKFLPNEEISASIYLYDQAGNEMNESMMVSLYDAWGLDVSSKMINNTEFKYAFKHDAAPGNWWIYAYASGIKERAFFYMDNYKQINISLEGEILKIQNMGNVEYDSPVEIIFSSESENKTESIQLKIPVNKDAVYKLNAPDGNYRITVNGQEIEQSFDATLTGKVISVNSMDATNVTKTMIVWIFIALIICFSLIARYKTDTRNISVRVKHLKE